MKKIVVTLWLLISILYCGLAWAEFCAVSVHVQDAWSGSAIEGVTVENCGKTDQYGNVSCSGLAPNSQLDVTTYCYKAGSIVLPPACSVNPIPLTASIEYINAVTCTGDDCPLFTCSPLGAIYAKGSTVPLIWDGGFGYGIIDIYLSKMDGTNKGIKQSWPDESNDGAKNCVLLTTLPTGTYQFSLYMNGLKTVSTQFYVP